MAQLKNTTINDTGFLKLPAGNNQARPPSPSTGNIRVNTEFDVEEIYNGTDWVKEPTIIKDGLACYLDAGNLSSYNPSVSTTAWNDISGNGRNFVWQSNPVYRRSYSSAWFETSGRRALGPASNSFGINNTSGYTIFYVARTTSFSANGAFKFYNTLGRTGSSNSRGIFVHPGWQNSIIYFDQGGCCADDQRLQVGLPAEVFQAWQVWALRSTVATRSIFRNGVREAHTTITAADVNLGTAGVDLGNVDEAYDWVATLGSFAVYNRGLTDAEVIEVSNVLLRRFSA